MKHVGSYHRYLLRFAAYGLTFTAGVFATLSLQTSPPTAAGSPSSHPSSTPEATAPNQPETTEFPHAAAAELVAFKQADFKSVEHVEDCKNGGAESPSLVVSGTTEPAAGRFAKVPLATSQAVAFVDATLGCTVKKGWQLFSHWESPERLQVAKAEIAKAKKLCDIATLKATAADAALERTRSLAFNEAGGASESELENAQTNASVRSKEVEAAKLYCEELEGRFAALKFEFEQAFVTSPIDGVVTSVDVIPGERRTLSGPFRGVTILDPSVLQCKCLLNSGEFAKLQSLLRRSTAESPNINATEPASLNDNHSLGVSVECDGSNWSGKILSVGIQADKLGLIPVVIEVPNPRQNLVCGVQVEVIFQAGPK